MKRCITCSFVKPFAEFYHKKSECKDCLKDRSLKRQLMTAYGITKEEKEEMVRMQGNRCALCGVKFSDSKEINVDHCHTNGGIRGILCRHCNVGLGHFKDSPKLLRRAIKYINDYIKTITTTPIPAGANLQGELYPELGSFSATWPGEDDDDPHHHCGTISREDLDHRTQASSRDSVGHGGKEMGTFEILESLQNFGIALSAATSPEPTRGHFLSELRKRGLVDGTEPELPKSGD